jgi:hypothetical protein
MTPVPLLVTCPEYSASSILIAFYSLRSLLLCRRHECLALPITLRPFLPFLLLRLLMLIKLLLLPVAIVLHCSMPLCISHACSSASDMLPLSLPCLLG